MDNKTNKHEFACNAGKVTEYEVKEHIDTIMVGFRGFSKEVSILWLWTLGGLLEGKWPSHRTLRLAGGIYRRPGRI